MKFLIIIFLFSLVLDSFGQDSTQVDTTGSTFSPALVNTTSKDSLLSVKRVVSKKRSRKKAELRDNKKFDTIQNAKEVLPTSNPQHTYRNIFALILIFGVIIGLAIYRSTLFKRSNPDTFVADGEWNIPDYVMRRQLSRRDYYRNVYLKSAAWQRKRYLVLKRDNWRCVYCGEEATEVHHTKYAKIKFGKEPIEWLVSVCGPCHDSKHHLL